MIHSELNRSQKILRITPEGALQNEDFHAFRAWRAPSLRHR